MVESTQNTTAATTEVAAPTKPALRKPTFIQINKLEPGSRCNMHLRVHSVKVIRERKRYDGGAMNRVAECLVGDEFGCVKLIATDEQLDFVKEGSVVVVRNAHANVVKEHMRIEIDRWAKIEPSNEKVASVNVENNQSDIEYVIVSVKQ